MRRILLLGLVIAGCSGRPAPEPAAAKIPTVATAPRSAPPSVAPAAPTGVQEALDALDEQISGGTMFCVESRANDCPSSFSCVDGACVADATAN